MIKNILNANVNLISGNKIFRVFKYFNHYICIIDIN